MTKGHKTGLTVAGIALGGFLLYKFAAKKQAVGQLRYRLGDVSLKLQGLALLVKINLVVTNPSAEKLQFKNFYGKLYLDSVKVGNVDIPHPVLINPKSDTPVILSTVLSSTQIINSLLDVIATGNTPSAGIIDGVLNIGNLQLPIYEKFDMNLKS